MKNMAQVMRNDPRQTTLTKSLVWMLTILAFGVALGIAAVYVRRSQLRSLCEAHIRRMILGEAITQPYAGRSPESFAEFSDLPLRSDLFVCPATGSRPGAATTVNEWTDYICVSRPGQQQILCPPMNHHGVGCIDGEWLPADVFDRVMTSIYEEADSIVVVSTRLQSRSRGHYYSKTRGTSRQSPLEAY